jgi:hypothetical protein
MTNTPTIAICTTVKNAVNSARGLSLRLPTHVRLLLLLLLRTEEGLSSEPFVGLLMISNK